MNIFSSSDRRSTPHHSKSGDLSRGTSRKHPLSRDPASASEQEGGKEGGFSRALTAALFALPVTVIIGLILLLIVTAVAYANPDPDSLTTPLSLITLGLTSLLGGLVAARRGRSAPILCGLLSGILFTLLLLGGSLFWSDEMQAQLSMGLPTPVIWGLHGGVVLMSMLGAKIGSPKTDKVRHRHPSRR